MPRAAVVHAEEYRCDIGPHVFPMDKFDRVREALEAAGDLEIADLIHPQPASRDDLLLAHTKEYLDDLEALRITPRTACSELPLTEEIVRAYTYAAGGTTRAAREALDRSMAVNLGGGFHHAYADMASGFCYLNDLVVAVLALRRAGKIRRAAVVDCDLHQGNGTAHLCRELPEVFTFSIHQEHLYPVKERSDLDIGLDNGTGDDEYNERLAEGLDQVWAHRPEIVLYQAGADPFEEDQLGALKLTMPGLEQRDRLVLEGCHRRGIPAVVTLGGGYARRLSDTVRIHARTCQIAIHLANGGPPA